MPKINRESKDRQSFAYIVKCFIVVIKFYSEISPVSPLSYTGSCFISIKLSFFFPFPSLRHQRISLFLGGVAVFAGGFGFYRKKQKKKYIT